jgi:peptidoglycan glycosyltransferase
VLPAERAQRIAESMRRVVLRGTARSLTATLGPDGGNIAGKTGTAEIAGAASHAWFVGFAPASGSGRRIAFAVLIENGGYGGEAAVPLAGAIVTEARTIGVIP